VPSKNDPRFRGGKKLEHFGSLRQIFFLYPLNHLGGAEEFGHQSPVARTTEHRNATKHVCIYSMTISPSIGPGRKRPFPECCAWTPTKIAAALPLQLILGFPEQLQRRSPRQAAANVSGNHQRGKSAKGSAAPTTFRFLRPSGAQNRQIDSPTSPEDLWNGLPSPLGAKQPKPS